MSYYLLHSGQPSARRLNSKVPRLTTYVSTSQIRNSDYLLRWGTSVESDPPNGTILNTQEAIARTVSRSMMSRFFKKIGVRFLLPPANANSTLESTRFTRHYRIPFFDLMPLSCFQSDTGATWINHRIHKLQPSFREVDLNEDRVVTRAVFLATRAIHALGLDFGMVSLGLGPKGLLHVLDISPTPVLNGRLLELYSQAIEQYMEREDRLLHTGIQNVKLGTDIEVMLRNPQGKMVLASNYFTRKGRVGCDARSVQFDGKRLPLMELRPDPDTTPEGLYHNLREVMQEAVRKINREHVEWRGGSMPFRAYSTGAHLHFSNVPFSSQFVKALDNYVGLPLMAVEEPKTAQLRRPQYGFLGDVRHKEYGGFEYRTPASFIVDSEITLAAFCLAYLVALYHRELPCFDLYSLQIQQAFYEGNKEEILPIILRNHEYLRRVPLYERYREYIEILFDKIEQGQTWDENVDIREVWGLPKRQERVKAASNRMKKARAASG